MKVLVRRIVSDIVEVPADFLYEGCSMLSIVEKYQETDHDLPHSAPLVMAIGAYLDETGWPALSDSQVDVIEAEPVDPDEDDEKEVWASHARMALTENGFFSGYVDCALWTSDFEGIDSPSVRLAIEDETLIKMYQDANKFVHENTVDLQWLNGKGFSYNNAGHDFWLTRNGHGAGFWDRREIAKEQQDRLTKSSKDFGEYSLQASDTGTIFGL